MWVGARATSAGRRAWLTERQTVCSAEVSASPASIVELGGVGHYESKYCFDNSTLSLILSFGARLAFVTGSHFARRNRLGRIAMRAVWSTQLAATLVAYLRARRAREAAGRSEGAGRFPSGRLRGRRSGSFPVLREVGSAGVAPEGSLCGGWGVCTREESRAPPPHSLPRL